MSNLQTDEVTQSAVNLPDGSPIVDNGPIVIIGPNGSGKTRRSRALGTSAPLEVVNALRMTKISAQLQAMTTQDARTNFTSQKNNAKQQPYEVASDFDFMLIQLVGESADVSSEYLRQKRTGANPELPALATLEKIQNIWSRVFPGRDLRFQDFRPLVRNSNAVGDEPVEYSAFQMSDGEKAALYLAGRVYSADPGVAILVDEPETHFHTLLAVRFWDLMEAARPDVRFIYATHDMTFAVSRKAVKTLLANPTSGLTEISLGNSSENLAATLLGTASLSFFATKIVFCEGEIDSLDSKLYSAWFGENETVVQAVGSCDVVMRSVSALSPSNLVQNLEVRGIIDRDFHSDDRLSTLTSGVHPLKVHEVETLFALPSVVAAVAKHLSRGFDASEYTNKIVQKYSDSDRHAVVIERWKTRVERLLGMVVSQVTAKSDSLESITASLPTIFASSNWDFDPKAILDEEKARVEAVFAAGTTDLGELLRIMPGKQLQPLGPTELEMKRDAYIALIIKAVSGEDAVLDALGADLRAALGPYMPDAV